MSGLMCPMCIKNKNKTRTKINLYINKIYNKSIIIYIYMYSIYANGWIFMLTLLKFTFNSVNK